MKTTVLLFLLALASLPVNAQTPIYFYLPGPNALLTLVPGIDTIPLTAVCVCPRVDFYAGTKFIGTSTTPAIPPPQGAPPIPKDAFYYGVIWKPTPGIAVNLHAYACSLVIDCDPQPKVSKNGRSYVTQLADTMIENVRPILTPAPSPQLRRAPLPPKQPYQYPNQPEREPKPGPPSGGH